MNLNWVIPAEGEQLQVQAIPNTSLRSNLSSLKAASQSNSHKVSDTQSSFNFKNSYLDKSNFAWKLIKWLKNHIDLVQLSVVVFLAGNILSVPISHGIRLWKYKKAHEFNKEKSNIEHKLFQNNKDIKKPTQVDLYIGLRNDISYLLLGFLTYTLPVLAFDKLGQRVAKNQAIKDLMSGQLSVNNTKDLKDLCKYLGALIGLLLGLVTNDIFKSTSRPFMEEFIDKRIRNNKEIIKFSGLDYEKLHEEFKVLERSSLKS